MDRKGVKHVSVSESFFDFSDLVEYTLKNRMCTKPGCTTCGCMPYRNLVRGIGEKEFLALLARTDDHIDRILYVEWYNPLCVAALTLPEIRKSPSTIMQMFLRTEETLREQSRKRQLAHEERMKIEHEESLRRKAEREEKKLANRTKQLDANEKRAKVMAVFSEMTLEDKMKTIAVDTERNPLFYGLDFELISDDELRAVPNNVLELLVSNLDKHGDKRIRKFSERIHVTLNSDIG